MHINKPHRTQTFIVVQPPSDAYDHSWKLFLKLIDFINRLIPNLLQGINNLKYLQVPWESTLLVNSNAMTPMDASKNLLSTTPMRAKESAFNDFDGS